MFLSYQYRLYPLRDQLPFLDNVLAEMTYLWNYALAQRRDAWTRSVAESPTSTSRLA